MHHAQGIQEATLPPKKLEYVRQLQRTSNKHRVRKSSLLLILFDSEADNQTSPWHHAKSADEVKFQIEVPPYPRVQLQSLA